MPLAIFDPVCELRGLAAQLRFEGQQAEEVFRWGKDGPEPECPLDGTRFLALVQSINAAATSTIRALAPWIATIEAEARALDAATAAVAARRASVTGDDRPQRVTILEPRGAGDA
jgi:hypothetical protein